MQLDILKQKKNNLCSTNEIMGVYEFKNLLIWSNDWFIYGIY